MVYFISGHRDLSYSDFETFYVPVLQRVINEDKEVEFVVGDCKGVDSMAQDWLRDNLKDLSKVTVFHMLEKPRHLSSQEFNVRGGFESDISRDAAMTLRSDVDIAFIKAGRWNSGTAQNLLRRYEI